MGLNQYFFLFFEFCYNWTNPSNRGREWNRPKKNCRGEQEALLGSTYPVGEPPAVTVVNKVLSTMKKPVYLLDITTLSQLRKDGHPSAYGGDGGNDCSHWCLPGLPDTWNHLFYATLLMWSQYYPTSIFILCYT